MIVNKFYGLNIFSNSIAVGRVIVSSPVVCKPLAGVRVQDVVVILGMSCYYIECVNWGYHYSWENSFICRTVKGQG